MKRDVTFGWILLGFIIIILVIVLPLTLGSKKPGGPGPRLGTEPVPSPYYCMSLGPYAACKRTVKTGNNPQNDETACKKACKALNGDGTVGSECEKYTGWYAETPWQDGMCMCGR